jgi:RNA polymerase sigma-70 factor (ECF subfamily)
MTGFSISMDLAPNRLELKLVVIVVLLNNVCVLQDTGRALVMMESATQGQQGIAMDLVQEAFISLHKSYSDKSIEEWYPLFYTILNNKLQDWRRKEARRAILFLFSKKLA